MFATYGWLFEVGPPSSRAGGRRGFLGACARHVACSALTADDVCHTSVVQMPLTVRLDEELEGLVDLAARRLRKTRSEVVRSALREFCGRQVRGGGEVFETVRHLVGAVDAGPTDLASAAERYLRESFGGRRRSR